jgi:hypothetical protein
MNSFIESFINKTVSNNCIWFTDADVESLSSASKMNFAEIKILLLDHKLKYLNPNEKLRETKLPDFLGDKEFRLYRVGFVKFKETLEKLNSPIVTNGLEDIYTLVSYLVDDNEGKTAVTESVKENANRYRKEQNSDYIIKNKLEKILNGPRGQGRSEYNMAIGRICSDLKNDIFSKGLGSKLDASIRKNNLKDVWEEIEKKKGNLDLLRTTSFAEDKIKRIEKQGFTKQVALKLYNMQAGLLNSIPYFDIKYFDMSSGFVAVCPNCKSVLEFESEQQQANSKCPYCEYSFSKKCPLCGEITSNTTETCRHCGISFSDLEKIEKQLTKFDEKVGELKTTDGLINMFPKLERILDHVKNQIAQLPSRYSENLRFRCNACSAQLIEKREEYVAAVLRSGKSKEEKYGFAVECIKKYNRSKEAEDYINLYLPNPPSNFKAEPLSVTKNSLEIRLSFDTNTTNEHLSYHIVRNSDRQPTGRNDGTVLSDVSSGITDILPIVDGKAKTYYALFPVLTVAKMTYELESIRIPFSFKQDKIKGDITAKWLPNSAYYLRKFQIALEDYYPSAWDNGKSINAELSFKFDREISKTILGEIELSEKDTNIPASMIRKFNKYVSDRLQSKAPESYFFNLVSKDVSISLNIEKCIKCLPLLKRLEDKLEKRE